MSKGEIIANTGGSGGTGADLPDSVWQIRDEAALLGADGSPDGAMNFDELVERIESTTVKARQLATRHVSVDQLLGYWANGRWIVVYEQNGSDRAQYGDKTLVRLSKRLGKRMGRGFSRSNLQYMRLLYLRHPDYRQLLPQLTFSHYCELLDVEDDAKRSFYEREAASSGWSVRELRRQMDSMLFERVLNARSDAGRDDVLALAERGVEYADPGDIIRDPYVLEFLDLPDEPPLEGDLQRALVAQIEKFMLELGRGFMFVGSNVRIPVGSDKDFADMVFYCKPLRAYVIIELKTTKLMASAVGQVNEYLNYFSAEVNDEYDNPPIGIILCTDRNNVRAEYALGGLDNAIFASTYTLQLPERSQLEDQVRRTIEASDAKGLPDGGE